MNLMGENWNKYAHRVSALENNCKCSALNENLEKQLCPNGPKETCYDL